MISLPLVKGRWAIYKKSRRRSFLHKINHLVMKIIKIPILLIALFLLIFGCTKDTIDEAEFIEKPQSALEKNGNSTIFQKVPVVEFQPAGSFGGSGNVLTPGDVFPPLGKSFATLKRGNNYLNINIHTKGLPQGAYTVWWIIFNEPSDCSFPNPFDGVCGGDFSDLFISTASIVWATGGIVQANGVGNFQDRIDVGELRSETVSLGSDLSSPLENPKGAEVHFIIKYHGLASSDPAILYAQTHTLLGSCDGMGGANSYALPPEAGGPYQCFDPQAGIFPAP